MTKILVAEDNTSLRKLMCIHLQRAGYHVLEASDGLEALHLLDHNHADLIIADIMMPRMDGYELLKTIREEGYKTPFLMLTAKEALEDKEKGFSLGTDDYMTKPFSSDELVWRTQALLRRADIAQSKKIEIGSVTVDSSKYAVYNDKEYIELPKKEFDLLFKLLSYPDRIFPKSSCLTAFGG